MKAENFAWLAKYLLDNTGLVLGADKMYLVESRLGPIARKYDAAGLDALTDALRAGRSADLKRDIIDAMMTNESFFFRDVKPFEQLRQVLLPRLLQMRAAQRAIRIWCAACSTGQEPYTIAMILKEEESKLAGWRTEIIATDLSHDALERARAGVYSQFEVQRGLPIQLLVKYFTQNGDRWQIAPALRSMVQFRALNLLGDFAGLGMFDIVLCRNVLIYFDQATKTAILDRISRVMQPDGYLFLGGAETVLGVSEKFAPVENHRGIYELAADAAGMRRAAGG